MCTEIRDYQYIDRNIPNDAVLETLSCLSRRELKALKDDAEWIIGRDSFGIVTMWVIFFVFWMLVSDVWSLRLEPFTIRTAILMLTVSFEVIIWLRMFRSRRLSRFLVRRAFRMRPLIDRSMRRFEITIEA